jgi:hypothetical protein
MQSIRVPGYDGFMYRSVTLITEMRGGYIYKSTVIGYMRAADVPRDNPRIVPVSLSTSLTRQSSFQLDVMSAEELEGWLRTAPKCIYS